MKLQRLWAMAACLPLQLVLAQDAPMAPPRIEVLPSQRVGDIVLEGAAIPVWTAPAVDARPAATGAPVSDAALLGRIPPPPRRRATVPTLDGAAARPEWRAVVPGGEAVPLAAAVVRIAPPGLRAPFFDGVDAATLRTPVSWSGGLDRATALEGLLRANGMRAVVGDDALTIARVELAEAAVTDDAAAWRRRAVELEAAAQEARRAEVATLAREREEIEARRVAAELQLREVQESAERLQLEHRSRLATLDVAFAEREWRMSPHDATLRLGLQRWARLEGVGFVWEADYDLPVLAELAYRGPLPAVLEQLLGRVPPSSRLVYSLDRRHGLVVRKAPDS